MKLTKQKASDAFPIVVSKGHASVKIYRSNNRGGDLYTLAYQTPAGRVRENFADLADAKRHASAKVASMFQGDVEAGKFTASDRLLLTASLEALDGTGVALDVAAREYAAAVEILGHGRIVEAAKYYVRHAEAGLPDVMVSDAVARFAEAKSAEGMSALYRKDIRLILGKLATAFQCLLKDIIADDLRAYMSRLRVGAVAKNNHRRLIVALFNFAKAQGWLSKTETTAADALGAAKVVRDDVEIYTPAEMTALLAAADVEFLPWLALIGFGGVRREELHKGLSWENIYFNRRCIIVPAAIAKTNRKRKIDMADNLVTWLEPYRNNTGPIFAIDPRKRMAKVSKASGVAWKPNALRHSFGSYRMEATKNAGQVALEMGNSPAVVMAHYHEIVHDADAKAYWNIRQVS
ncbi:MAG TPA: hypothetical protein VIT91_19020 [Chthoniobacterales bacterium]